MGTFFFIIGKFLLSSALLIVLYWVVLRNRASYRLSRVYLISLPLVCLMMSGLTYEVVLPSFRMSEESIEPVREIIATPMQDMPQELEFLFNAPSVQPVRSEEGVETLVQHPTVVRRSIDYRQWLCAIISVISIVLLLMAFFYVGKLLWLKSRLKAQKTEEGYDLIRSGVISVPFSFGRCIFMPIDLDGASERLILNHEKAHIAHHHYLEVWLMEFMTRLMWFNPVMWICRSELSNVQR